MQQKNNSLPSFTYYDATDQTHKISFLPLSWCKSLMFVKVETTEIQTEEKPIKFDKTKHKIIIQTISINLKKNNTMKKYKDLNKAANLQLWTNILNMSKRERKQFIKYIISLNEKNCGWIEYAQKQMLITLVKNSECFFNDSGRTTPVKEFQENGL